MTVYSTITGIVILNANTVALRTPFAAPLPLSGPVESSPFVLAGAARLRMDRVPLQHVAEWNGAETITIPPSAFRQGRAVEVVVDGQVVATIDGWQAADVSMDGVVDAIDLDLFTAWWLSGDIRSDFFYDGFSDALDYDRFMNAWLIR